MSDDVDQRGHTRSRWDTTLDPNNPIPDDAPQAAIHDEETAEAAKAASEQHAEAQEEADEREREQREQRQTNLKPSEYERTGGQGDEESEQRQRESEQAGQEQGQQQAPQQPGTQPQQGGQTQDDDEVFEVKAKRSKKDES